jgi:hypothetical protein
MLKVSNYDQKIVDYTWTYVDENGVVAAIKNICLSYDNGRLSSFLNNWPLYKIADTKATISQEQAVKIALAAAENYTYQVNTNNTTSTISVAGFQFNPKSLSMATLSYDNSHNQNLTRDSAFTLYPSWYIPLGFDKAYPADVTGIAVSIWADTGEVVGMSPMTCGGAYEASTHYQSSESSFLLGPAITFVLVLFFMALFVNRKRVLRLTGTNKLGNLKFWSLLFCLSILSGFTVSTVNATPTTSSRIYASNWAQMSAEMTAMQYDIKPYLTTYFNGNAEFDFFDNTETGTVLPSIQAYANYDGATYDSAIVFYLGHMAHPEYVPGDPGLRDNAAQVIMPNDISGYTQAGKHRFMFLWACDQADNGASSGMVQAWLPGITSSDGVLVSDNSGKCFIGFAGTSPPIADWTPHPTFNDMSSYPMEWFIVWFYYDTIVEHRTVAYALNHASLEIVGSTFTASKLYTGYHTYWPNSGGDDYYDGRMVVCGDANIHLWDYMRTLSISSATGGYTTPTGTQEYMENSIVITAYPDTGSGYAFDYWIYDGWLHIYNNSTQVCMADDHTLAPVFVQNTYTTTVNIYQTWGGSPLYINYQGSVNIQLPYGSNYLDFTNGPSGGYFMYAYNYADSSTHYSSADWYWTGTGTSIDVLWTW